MYYTLEFWMDSNRYNDENEAKKLIDSYNNVDRCVIDTKYYESPIWLYVLGSNNTSDLERIIEDITQKEGFKPFEIKVYETKDIVINHKYKHHNFY